MTHNCIKEFTKKVNKTMGDMRRSFERISTSCEKMAEESHQATQFILKEFKSHNQFLEQMTSLTENIDETLGNVLLAIRQNEYLQAYYPAQHGFPDLKVTGKHPAKITPIPEETAPVLC